jgi:hypothetical protein
MKEQIAASNPAQELMKTAYRLDTFDYTGVQLLPSRFLTQVETAQRVYGSLANDDVLKGFRQAAGLPDPGQGMLGWCKATSAVIFGQLLSGMTRLGKARKDPALVDKAVNLFEGWSQTLSPDGNARMRLYDWDKLVCGLVDLATYAGVDTIPVLRKTTQWAARTFDRSRCPADGHDFWGAGPGDTSEWYTLPENLYRAYQLSGETLFKEFADLWLYEDFWRPFAESAFPPLVRPVHAYSHVNAFSSAAMAYVIKGERRYLNICMNAFDFVQNTQCYATGAYGPDERLMAPDGSLGRSLDLSAFHAEIPCGSWAGFKLCLYLMRFTGEACYGDWIEAMLYNCMGASLPTQADGTTFYYADYSISAGRKTFYWHKWPCCSGTYLQNMAEYHNLVFLKDADGIFINLFVPAEVLWDHRGEGIRILQTTRYPEDDEVSVTLAMARPCAFSVNIRIPKWSMNPSFSLNGDPISVVARPGTWARIDRVWNHGDHLAFIIPMQLRTAAVDRQHSERIAILYGPVALAQDEACCRRPFSLAPQTDLNSRLIKEEPELRFRILNTIPERHTRYLVPLYQLPAFWPYWVYFDLDAAALY